MTLARSLPVNRLPVVSGRPRTAAHQKAADNEALIWFILQRRFSFLLSDPDRLAEAYTAGYLALIHAAQHFDAAKGFQFASYAGDCIRGAILRTFWEHRRAHRLETVSLDVPLGEDGSHLEDVIADTQARQPERECVQAIAFAQRIARLDARTQAVLRALYEDGQDAGDVAQALGISRQRVHQIHARALDALRERKPAKGALTAKERAVLWGR